ncbi:DUF7302 family protein [Rhodococcus artemisiae]|uniref:Head-to-tail connector protein n=1 Tax=Rhodococcus artemisiae TaxID=714159 RepID=A0ABU7LBQ1_9NOCA|nr:hypothetical protein [Rhodococcus artemisiae]MEE2058968.1 hypothetical protein [Rhodococcus artemisiae]
MPRLKNKVTGAVVTVDDALAEKLSRDWEPADAKPARRTTRKKVADPDEE